MLNVCRVIDDDPRRKRWDRDLEGIKADLPFTLHKPIEELVPRLEKPDAIASERQRARRPSIVWSVAAECLDGLCACGSLFPWRLMADRWP